MSEPNVEQPVEDVLEQQDKPESTRDLPDEANEADYAEQQIEVPVEDDRYPDGSV